MIDWYLITISLSSALLGVAAYLVGGDLWRRVQQRLAARVERQERRIAARLAFVKAVSQITHIVAGPPVAAAEVGSYSTSESKPRRKAWPK